LSRKKKIREKKKKKKKKKRIKKTWGQNTKNNEKKKKKQTKKKHGSVNLMELKGAKVFNRIPRISPTGRVTKGPSHMGPEKKVGNAKVYVGIKNPFNNRWEELVPIENRGHSRINPFWGGEKVTFPLWTKHTGGDARQRKK